MQRTYHFHIEAHFTCPRALEIAYPRAITARKYVAYWAVGITIKKCVEKLFFIQQTLFIEWRGTLN